MVDPVKNFAKVTVSLGYDASDVSITLVASSGSILPDPAADGDFNLVWWDSTTYPDPADDPNKEIVRCTALSTDTLTITRGQESTSASTKNTSGSTYKMVLAVTKKTIDDLVAESGNVSTNGTPVDDDFAKFVNGTDIEGRSYTEVRSDLNIEDGATANSADAVLLARANHTGTQAETTITTSDITTNDVSSTKHGFAPKGDGSATSYLNGIGAYSTPAGGGGVNYGNTITVATSGGDYTSIQAAINASTSGDTILIYDGTYSENVTTKAGAMTTLVGMGTMGSVVIEANTGNVLTVPSAMMSMAFIKNIKLKSTATGANASKLFYGEGTMTTFTDVSFDYNISNGYTEEIIDLEAGSYIFTGCKFDFDGTGTAGGATSFISVDGAVEFQVMQGFSTMSYAAVGAADRMRFVNDISTGSNIIRDFDFKGEATSASYAGGVGFYMSTNSNEVELLGNKIVLTTPSGIGASRGNAIHMDGVGGGHVHATTNRVSVTGFVDNNFGMVSATETFCSHFDDIVASSGVTGDGTYNYANSPSDGDIQMSGWLIRKVVDITADYGITEDWDFGIINLDSTTATDATVTIKLSSFTDAPSGAGRTFLNSSATYNMIIDPNGVNFGGSTDDRVIYPGGYIIIEKIGTQGVITSSYNTSFNIELTDIANKSFHVDFSDAATVTVSGTDITQVNDKIHPWAGTPSSTGRAKYGTTTQNGLNTALWDTSNSPISFGDNDIHSNTAGRGMTIIAVVKANNTGDAILSKYYDASPQREWRFYSSNLTIYTNLDASGVEAIINYSSNYGEWQVLEINWVTGGGATAYKNGFLLGTSSYDVTTIPAGTADLLMGASDLVGADFVGEIGEIIALSDTLTSTEREALTSKLGAKWGIDTAVYSASDSSPFGRDDTTDTIKSIITGDHLGIDGNITVGGYVETDNGTKLYDTGADNFYLMTGSNTPNPNLSIGYGNGAGALDTALEYLAINGGYTWARNSGLKVDNLAYFYGAITASETATFAKNVVINPAASQQALYVNASAGTRASNTNNIKILDYRDTADASYWSSSVVVQGANSVNDTAPLMYLMSYAASPQTALAIDAIKSIVTSGSVDIGGDFDLNNNDFFAAKTITYQAEYDNGNSGTADTINWNNAQYQKSLLTGNCTYTFTPPTNGVSTFTLKLIQDATGNRSITWPSSVNWPGDTEPAWDTSAAATTFVDFYYDGTEYWGDIVVDTADMDTINYSTTLDQKAIVDTGEDGGVEGGVFNGDFESAPEFVAATSTNERWIDGTATGSVTNDTYRWSYINQSATGSASLEDGALKLIGTTLGAGTAVRATHIAEILPGMTLTAAHVTRYGIPIKPSTKYRVSYRIKLDGITNVASGGASVNYLEYAAAGGSTVVNTSDSYVTGTSDYQYREIIVTTNAASSYAFIQPSILFETGTAWFDDIKFEQIDTQTVDTQVVTPAGVSVEGVTTTDNVDHDNDGTEAWTADIGRVTPTVNGGAKEGAKLTLSESHLTSVDVYLHKTGSPTDNLVFSIVTDAAGNPSTTIQASAIIAGTSLTTSTVKYTIDLPCIIDTDDTYWLVAERSSIKSNTDYYNWSLIAGSAGESKQCDTSWSNQYGDNELRFMSNFAKHTESPVIEANGSKLDMTGTELLTGATITVNTDGTGKYKLHLPIATSDERIIFAHNVYAASVGGRSDSSCIINGWVNGSQIDSENGAVERYITFKCETSFPLTHVYGNITFGVAGGSVDSKLQISLDNEVWDDIIVTSQHLTATQFSTNCANGHDVFYIRYLKEASSNDYAQMGSVLICADLDCTNAELPLIVPSSEELSETLDLTQNPIDISENEFWQLKNDLTGWSSPTFIMSSTEAEWESKSAKADYIFMYDSNGTTEWTWDERNGLVPPADRTSGTVVAKFLVGNNQIKSSVNAGSMKANVNLSYPKESLRAAVNRLTSKPKEETTIVDMENYPIINAKTITFNEEYDNGDSGAADTIDFGNGQNQKSTMTGACTYTFTAPASGVGTFKLKLIQDATGSRVPTWPASVTWLGTEPTWSTTAAAVDIASFYWDGTEYWGAGAVEASSSGGGSSTVNMYLPAEAAYLPVTNPAGLVEEAGATVYAGHSHLTFDDTTSEHAVWRVPVPDYDAGDIIVTAYSKVATTPSSAVTLQYNILTIGLATSEAFDAAVTADTGVNISHSLTTADLLTDIMVASATIDPANVAADDLMVIELSRDVASDTLAGDGELVGIMLEYTRA